MSLSWQSPTNLPIILLKGIFLPTAIWNYAFKKIMLKANLPNGYLFSRRF